MARILTLFTEGYADWECAFLHGAGRAYLGLDIVTATPDGQPVRSQGGVRTMPDTGLSTLDGFDAIVVPGGTIWETPAAPDIGALLRAAAGAGQTVATICGATLAAARAGLLDDRDHTSNGLAFLTGNVGTYAGQTRYRDVPHAVSDRGVITASGAAPVSFTAAVMRALVPERDADIGEFEMMMAREHRPPGEAG